MKNNKKLKRNDGFTLIEMLLVLLVISVLIILIIPNIARQSENVQNVGCEAQVKMVQSQIESYTLNEGVAPSSMADLVSLNYINDGQTSCANGDSIRIVNGEATRS